MFEGYSEVSLLAEGGLGRVYRATRLSTGGVVAIKELRDLDISNDANTLASRELQVLLQLKGHPHVISVEEFIQGPGGPCIVMEYAPGGSLHERVRSGRLPDQEVVLVAQHTLSALAAAHEIGIIHRDIKPHNLLIGSFGQVKVCDFGIAALLSAHGITNPTEAITVAYASPEELDDGPITTATDIYSFGATLLHLATGNRPSFSHRTSPIAADEIIAASGIDPALRDAVELTVAATATSAHERPTLRDLADAFDRAAIALGPRRLQRLTPNPTLLAGTTPADAATVVRPHRSVTSASVDATKVRSVAPLAPPEAAHETGERATPILVPLIAARPSSGEVDSASLPRFEARDVDTTPAVGARNNIFRQRKAAIIAAAIAVLFAGGGAYAALGSETSPRSEVAQPLATLAPETSSATTMTTTTTMRPDVVSTVDVTTTEVATTAATTATTAAPRVAQPTPHPVTTTMPKRVSPKGESCTPLTPGNRRKCGDVVGDRLCINHQDEDAMKRAIDEAKGKPDLSFDLNGDAQVTRKDLAIVTSHLGLGICNPGGGGDGGD